jgi:hypothetical protein
MVISPDYLLACGIMKTRILLFRDLIEFAGTGASAGKEKPWQVKSDRRGHR